MPCEITRKSARIAYCGLFSASVVLSLILTQVAVPLLQIFPWVYYADHTKEWYQTNAVLRVSLGNFLFFSVFALIMSDVKNQNDDPDTWHNGRWIVKIIIWLLLISLMFLMPNVVVDIYGFLSKFGAGLFLLVQFVLLLDFTYTWNDACLENDELKWYMNLFAVSVGCYIASFIFSIVLFIWFNPSGHDCGLNVIFIVMTLILAVTLFAFIVCHPKVEGSLFPTSVISVFLTYVCYMGLSSEPRNYVCNGLRTEAKAVSISALILGMITAVLSIFYSALRAGSTKALLSSLSSPRAGEINIIPSPMDGGVYADMLFSGWTSLSDCSEDAEGGQDMKDSEMWRIRLSDSIFHLIFALTTMHSAMLLSGWIGSSDSSVLIDIGWTSVWVKICTECLSAGLFIWIHIKHTQARYYPGYWTRY